VILAANRGALVAFSVTAPRPMVIDFSDHMYNLLMVDEPEDDLDDKNKKKSGFGEGLGVE
jgi:hypothetical protein